MRQFSPEVRERAVLEHVGEYRSREGKLTTLSRGLGILEFVARSERFVRLRDVAEHFGLDRSAALRFLRTLEADGWLQRHEAMKLYSVGPKLLSFPRLPASVEQMIAIALRPGVEVAPISWTVCGLGSYVSTSAVCMLAL